MDRTIIAPWKAEEKELSDKLYNKLQGLMLLYPATEEFKKCISEDMFLKPNQHAFFQVMHYLFRLYDAAEFKKRFFWPIVDKRAEANFRTTTIEYLKYLNEKHNLQWTNIKSYLVVMPGGMKFITFLLDLIAFIISELTKQREKLLFGDGQVETIKQDAMLNIKRMRKQNEFFKEYASGYIAEIDNQKMVLKEKIDGIEREFNLIAQEVGITAEELKDDAFLANFEMCNEHIFRTKYVDTRVKLQSLEEPLAELRQCIDNFQTQKSKAEYDEKILRTALKSYDQSTNEKGDITMNEMINVLNKIKPQIDENLKNFNSAPVSSEFMKTELETLKTSSEQIESELTNFLKTVMKHDSNKTDCAPFTPMRQKPVSIVENQLISKLVHTPPIRLDLTNPSRATTRVSLLDETATKHLEPANLFFLAPPTSTRKPKRPEQSFDPNLSANKSKIIDPMQLLRTISKDKNKYRSITQHNISTVSAKWKQRQHMFSKDFNEVDDEITKSIQKTPSKTHTISPQSPITPFNSNESTLVQHASVLSADNNTTKVTKKSAVQKVHDAIRQFHNLSTSPSGRLVPLITVNDLDLSKMQLNDTTEDECPVKSADIKMPNEGLPHIVINNDIDLINNENNPNAINVNTQGTPLHKGLPNFVIQNPSSDEDDIELFNTSDTVLRDVIM